MAPKDQDAIHSKSGVIYRYQCDRVECDEEYIGESSRTFGERFKKHLKALSPIYDHYNTTGHNVTLDNFSICREGRAEPLQMDERSIVHKGKQSIPKQEHRQIPSASYMGWGSV